MQKTLRRVAAAACLLPALAFADLPAEPIPNVLKLETPYPGTYAVVHDFAFGSLIDSSFGLVDVTDRSFKGMLSAGQFATISHSVPRQRFYVGETVHSRGTRGERQDLITVYDFENLDLVAEIELPQRRANIVVNQALTAITSDDRFLLVFNMNPATSVSVVDLESNEFVGEIATPGCALVYPDSVGGFLQLCGNGTLASIALDENGGQASRQVSAVFNDIDNDPISEKASRIGDTWHFFTYGGAVQPVDVSGAEPKILDRWWLASEKDRESNWRPAGWHGNAGHASGNLWVGMTPDGYNGSHKDPAPEIWLFDSATGKRKARFELETPALSIAATHHEKPYLLVVNIAGQLDVYDGLSGKFQHSINELGETPYMVHPIGAGIGASSGGRP